MTNFIVSMQFTATVEQGENGFYIGQIEELPSAISQGRTIEELKINLSDAIGLILNIDDIDCLIKIN